MMYSRRRLFLVLATSHLLAFTGSAGAQTPPPAQVEWPSLTDLRAIGGGEKDAAVIAAVEKYTYVAAVPGARANAESWFEYLTRARGIPVDRVAMLRDQQVTVRKLMNTVKEAAKNVQPGGTLWFIFIGHGAPQKTPPEGLLVGADVQQEVDSLYDRSVAQRLVLKELADSPAGRVVAVIDACFSGRLADGKPIVTGLMPLVLRAKTELDPKVVLLTAAGDDEFAGPLPGTSRPAFSYLVLGGLRGWADADGNGTVTAQELGDYSGKVLRALVRDRTQTPTREGAAGAALGTAFEKGPDLIALVRRYGDAQAAAPRAELEKVPELQGTLSGAVKLGASIDALEGYDAAMKAEKGAAPRERAQAWGKLALVTDRNPYLAEAAQRAKQWQEHAERLEAQWKAAQEQASTLARSLRLSVLGEDQKFFLLERFAQEFGAHEGTWEILGNVVRGAPGAVSEQRLATVYDRGCQAGHAAACRLAPAPKAAVVKTITSSDLQTACDARQPDGCHSLGLAYLQGAGMAADPARAHRAFEKACNLGSAKGCYQQANLSLTGEGTSQDNDKAIAVFEKACKLSEPLACYNLGLIYAHGQGASQDHARAATYLTNACSAGEPKSCGALADLYEAGRGVPQSAARARELRERSCAQGNALACPRR